MAEQHFQEAFNVKHLLGILLVLCLPLLPAILTLIKHFG